jgi:hypothetical protein
LSHETLPRGQHLGRLARADTAFCKRASIAFPGERRRAGEEIDNSPTDAWIVEPDADAPSVSLEG